MVKDCSPAVGESLECVPRKNVILAKQRVGGSTDSNHYIVVCLLYGGSVSHPYEYAVWSLVANETKCFAEAGNYVDDLGLAAIHLARRTNGLTEFKELVNEAKGY